MQREKSKKLRVTKETPRPCSMRKIIVALLSSNPTRLPPLYPEQDDGPSQGYSQGTSSVYMDGSHVFNAEGLKLSVFPANEYRSRAYQLDVRGTNTGTACKRSVGRESRRRATKFLEIK